MTLKIVRNEEANCITFRGTTVPAYFNSCLSGEVNVEDSEKVNVRNDIRSEEQEEIYYEFFGVHYTEFLDKEGNTFNSALEVAEYITSQSNVIGVNEVGKNLANIVVNFRLDQTKTSIIMDNGSSFGVNTIKAVSDSGLIKIKSIGQGIPTGSEEPTDRVHFEKISHDKVKINNNLVTGGLNDVINKLNELFTVGAFDSVVITDPYSTLIADVDGEDVNYNLVGSTSIDPLGEDIFTNSSTGNLAGLLTEGVINDAGEYFTFDIRGEGQIGFGLVHTLDSYSNNLFSGNSNYANPSNFALINNAHAGFQFSHWFHPTPNGSWTNYGANTSFVTGTGWNTWDKQQDWLSNNPVKIKVGIGFGGHIEISSLKDDGVSWILHARSSYPLVQGASLRLGIKAYNSSARVFSNPKIHLLEDQAPTMYFRFIESPDGVFKYPLFATEEEANYYDLNNGGTGTHHTHTYEDDPTNTTWYMPDSNNEMNGSFAPSADLSLGQESIYTEITSLNNTDLAPSTFSNADLVYQEGSVINIPMSPVDVTYTTDITISPAGSGLVYNTATTMLQGTLSQVDSDTIYTITVTRANSYGSSIGSFTITVLDVPPPQTNDTSWNKALDFSGSSERAQIVGTQSYQNPLSMGHTGNTVSGNTVLGKTSSSNNARPWAIACVFKVDGNNSNQHIWNQGEGSGSSEDNIYLRLSSDRYLYFGWGRSSSLNECKIEGTLDPNTWYGIYIGFTGERLSSNNATASNLTNCFDIRLLKNIDNQWKISNNGIFAGQGIGDGQRSKISNWQNGSVGGRMDRSVTGVFTIGGRGSNRSFHGKVASTVITTLKNNTTMPDEQEILKIVTDPVKWLQDYKVNKPYRQSSSGFNDNTFDIDGAQEMWATQVYLMGDGSLDSYSNMIRNEVKKSDQNYTKLNLISMVSNDIQNITIQGLT